MLDGGLEVWTKPRGDYSRSVAVPHAARLIGDIAALFCQLGAFRGQASALVFRSALEGLGARNDVDAQKLPGTLPKAVFQTVVHANGLQASGQHICESACHGAILRLLRITNKLLLSLVCLAAGMGH